MSNSTDAITSKASVAIESLDELTISINATEEQIGNIAPVTEEQSATFEELAATIDNLTTIYTVTVGHANDSAKKMKDIGLLVENIRQTILKLKVHLEPSELIKLAITDHQLWVWRVDTMLLNNEHIDPNVSGNYHGCRLGKWIDSVDNPCKNLAEFNQLLKPHADFHDLAKHAVLAKNEGKNIVIYWCMRQDL